MKLIRSELKRYKGWQEESRSVLEYAEALAKEGKIPFEEINDHMTKKLKGIVSAGYVRKVLPNKYKNQSRSAKSIGRATSTATHEKTEMEY